MVKDTAERRKWLKWHCVTEIGEIIKMVSW